MPAKTRRTTKAKKAKKAKTPAVKKATKKAVAKTSPAKKTVKKHKQGKPKSAKTAKKPTAKKTAKKTAAKTSRATKTVKRQRLGKTEKAIKKRVTKSPTETTAWKISPENSQSVVEIDIWKKGDLKIEFLTVYRSGWIIVDQLPDLSGYNPDEGINIFEEFEFEDHQLHDASDESSVFPNELPEVERERLLALSEEELANEGWTLESVTRFSGPLLVEQV
jgi:hypothetical protein